MQKFEQAVSYIENGEAEKGLTQLKELVKQGTDEESMILLATIIRLDLLMKR